MSTDIEFSAALSATTSEADLAPSEAELEPQPFEVRCGPVARLIELTDRIEELVDGADQKGRQHPLEDAVWPLLQEDPDFQPVLEALANLPGDPGQERALKGGPRVTAWVDGFLGKLHQTRVASTSLELLDRMHGLGELAGERTIVLLEMLGILSIHQRYLVLLGIPEEAFREGRLLGMCSVLRVSPRGTERAARTVRFLHLLEPEVAEVIIEYLAEGMTLNRLDVLRRLLPVTVTAVEMKGILDRYGKLSLRRLREVGRLLLADSGNKELRARAYYPPDDDPVEELRRGLSSSLPLREGLPELTERYRYETRIQLESTPELFGRLQRVLRSRARGYELPGCHLNRRILDDAEALADLLTEFLTVLHPGVDPDRSGLRVGSDEVIVRTLCGCCLDELPVKEVEADVGEERLTRGDLPPVMYQLALARALGMCQVPGCHRHAQSVHHLTARHERIDHHLDNLLATCAYHHGLLHREDADEKLVITREPDGNLRCIFPGGRLVLPGDQSRLTSWKMVHELRQEAMTAGLFQSSVEDLVWGSSTWMPLAGTGPCGEFVPEQLEEPQPIPVGLLDDTPLAELRWLREVSNVGTLGLSEVVSGLYEKQRSRAGTFDYDPLTAGYGSLSGMLRQVHQLDGPQQSRLKVLGRALGEFPECRKVAYTHVGCVAKLLLVGRSGLDPGATDGLLARLMPHLSVEDFAKVIRSLQVDTVEPTVQWSLRVTHEVKELLSLACLEVSRARSCRATLEETIEYVLDAEALGGWPSVEGTAGVGDVPGAEMEEATDPLQRPSLSRRWGPPRYALATCLCARCKLAWQIGAGGEVIVPPRQRVQEALMGAEMISWIPGRFDRWAEIEREQPHPVAEQLALARDGGCMVPGCRHTKGGKLRPMRALPVEAMAEGQGLDGPWAQVPAEALLGICPVHLRALLRKRLKLQVQEDGSLDWSTPWTQQHVWCDLDVRKPRPSGVDVDVLLAEVEEREHPPPT